MFTHDGSMMAFGGFSMWIFWLFLLVVVVFIIKAVAGGNSGSSSSPRLNDSPLDIFKERYARGETDEEEFTRRRIELEK